MLLTSLLSDQDLYLFNEGTHARLYEKLGAHPVGGENPADTSFAVWAPNATRVTVMGDFNDWSTTSHPLENRGDSGIWEGILSSVLIGSRYKYHIVSRFENYQVDKGDPFAFCTELSPRTASVVWDLGYDWRDHDWMAHRGARQSLAAPMAIYSCTWAHGGAIRAPRSRRERGRG